MSPIVSHLLFVVVVICVATLGGCGRKPRPWHGRPGGVENPPPQPSPQSGDGGEASPPLSSQTPGAPFAILPRAAGRRDGEGDGGLWLRCAHGFRAGADPVKDVARLGLLCGPPNGMRRIGQGIAGQIGEGASRHPLPVRAGSCYRLFAVADAGVADLDVVVVSAHDSRVAGDDVEDRVVMVAPERPFCSFGDDELSVEVSAGRGRGRYALTIYELPADR